MHESVFPSLRGSSREGVAGGADCELVDAFRDTTNFKGVPDARLAAWVDSAQQERRGGFSCDPKDLWKDSDQHPPPQLDFAKLAYAGELGWNLISLQLGGNCWL